MFPFWEKWSWMNFPKRLELLLYTVLAFPKASMMGLQSEGKTIGSEGEGSLPILHAQCLSVAVNSDPDSHCASAFDSWREIERSHYCDFSPQTPRNEREK